jgi:hypothetical protein
MSFLIRSLEIIIVLTLVASLLFLVMFGIKVLKEKDGSCQSLLKQTCNTFNSLVDTTNKESGMLEQCYNLSTPFTRITHLNCEDLPQ